MKIYIDHSYTNDPHHRFLNKLKRLGFVEYSKPVRHPGGSYCRFIGFSAGNPRKRMYLEFVHRVPRPYSQPGLSLGYAGRLELLSKKLKSSKQFKTKLIHRNYDWQKSPRRERRAGWNFLEFEKRRFRGFLPWVTEYESTPERLKRKLPPKLVNGVSGIAGFDLILNADGIKFYESVLGRKISSSVQLNGGVILWIRPGKTNRICAVILKTKNVRHWARRTGIKDIVEFRGREAARIRNPDPKMWDILVCS